MGNSSKQAHPARGLREPCRPSAWRSEREARLYTQVAATVRNAGQSHRGYQVGVAAKIRDKDGNDRLVWGANKKILPGPRASSDHCAEEFCECGVRLFGGKILALVVYAIPERDDASGREEEVPIPCWYCRTRWRKQIATGTGPVTERTVIRRMNAENPELWKEDWIGVFLREYASDPQAI